MKKKDKFKFKEDNPTLADSEKKRKGTVMSSKIVNRFLFLFATFCIVHGFIGDGVFFGPTIYKNL